MFVQFDVSPSWEYLCLARFTIGNDFFAAIFYSYSRMAVHSKHHHEHSPMLSTGPMIGRTIQELTSFKAWLKGAFFVGSTRGTKTKTAPNMVEGEIHIFSRSFKGVFPISMVRNSLGSCFFLKLRELIHDWLVVSTHLKNISQNGNLPQIGMKIKNIWNHHPDDNMWKVEMVTKLDYLTTWLGNLDLYGAQPQASRSLSLRHFTWQNSSCKR